MQSVSPVAQSPVQCESIFIRTPSYHLKPLPPTRMSILIFSATLLLAIQGVFATPTPAGFSTELVARGLPTFVCGKYALLSVVIISLTIVGCGRPQNLSSGGAYSKDP